ncbi:MAG: bifunctional D-glycero-beta-D-manno-heptose-7-phosphate kinase/D-glycero-beta-D-manno-heptose 1-phosphate adenylyltransferase HldE [Proteobacteria bacterium]|nr:bifunctional D-glycero-beta-D-manno-heptose-7-phosphate kinase/D-glycero-beta-D-manno-heptose 1-phosphate adenylyltransferase HldE [Pseudomonadota bacterium]
MPCPDFSKARIIVVGDAMLDRYWHGDTSRISPEAPVPVVRIEQDEYRVGGAANVAVNVQALGAKALLVSGIGEDEAGSILATKVEEFGVRCSFIKSTNMRTTLKLRVIGRHQQLIRLDFEDKYRWQAAPIIDKCLEEIKLADVVILSDYAKGMLAGVQEIIKFATQHNVKVIVDPKDPNLTVYQGATILTPNLSEFEAAVGPCKNVKEIEQKGLSLMERLQLEALLITRGSQGMTLITPNHAPEHIPAQAREVFDITGAGDTVIAVLGACIATGTSILEAATLANIAGGLSVGRFGTATITADELKSALEPHRYSTSGLKGVLPVEVLLPELKRRKALGDKIVMTNGCFDILHLGHITYLEQARALGDCLIVAVNDDDSVKRLKGQTRPINSLQQRAKVLAALGCVDYVVVFNEDTPQRLIAEILPDILVKGGDYAPEQIAGGIEVIQNGGKIEILPFVKGCSTTSMIDRMILSARKQELSKEEIVA